MLRGVVKSHNDVIISLTHVTKKKSVVAATWRPCTPTHFYFHGGCFSDSDKN